MISKNIRLELFRFFRAFLQKESGILPDYRQAIPFLKKDQFFSCFFKKNSPYSEKTLVTSYRVAKHFFKKSVTSLNRGIKKKMIFSYLKYKSIYGRI